MSIDDPNSEDGDPPVQAVIELIDLADGRRRRIWAKTGTGDGFGLGWSPDGRRIAATYTEWQVEIDDGVWSTVVVDLNHRYPPSGEPPTRYGPHPPPVSSSGAERRPITPWVCGASAVMTIMREGFFVGRKRGLANL
ncbi:hypothetical protein ACIBH1_11980 [Nonomuraea sp. NPDC050663]|uniref:hypothetical protein n=1 Tax=Nonomuraea sp. NPDC050663 TaxID=3364370 RepID=UPI003797BD67